MCTFRQAQGACHIVDGVCEMAQRLPGFEIVTQAVMVRYRVGQFRNLHKEKGDLTHLILLEAFQLYTDEASESSFKAKSFSYTHSRWTDVSTQNH